MHLIRNSMDHGLETPEIRQQKGKPVAGTIHLIASLETNQVVLRLGDDGGGLALGRLRKKAEAQQLTVNSEQEVANLIFASGISTAEKVSDISGRGVGMDAVKRFLQDRGGDVSVVLKEGGSAEQRPFELHLRLPQRVVVQLPPPY